MRNIYDILEPADSLKPYIKYYKYVETDVKGTFKAISTGDVELYICLTHIRLFSAFTYDIDFPKILISGLHHVEKEAYTTQYGTGTGGGFVIVFRPLGFYGLFGIKEKDFCNYASDGCTMLRREFEFIWEKIQDLRDGIKIKIIVEDHLIDYLKSNRSVNTILTHIINFMAQNKGLIREVQLCKKFDLSPRSLQRYFKGETGLTCKEYLNIFRVNYALRMLTRNPDYDISDISYLCGYFDQSHFIKDFKNIIGLTPTQIKKGINHVIPSGDNRYFIDL